MATDAHVETTGRAERRIARLAWLGAWLVRLLGPTWRISLVNDELLRRNRETGQPMVFSLWHGHLLTLLYHHRREGVTVMISEHGDGEIIARIAERLGFHTVRGSTSRGAARALLEASRVVEDGRDLAVTPDGPRGPARMVAPGVAIVAHRAHAPVVAALVHARSAWRLSTWDRFEIPKPFSRVRIAYGQAFIEAAEARQAAAAAEQVAALMASTEQAAHG